jgi:hypothetical protein
MKAEDDIKGALEGLQKVLSMETEKGDWGFKALKQMVKLTFSKVRLYFPFKLLPIIADSSFRETTTRCLNTTKSC